MNKSIIRYVISNVIGIESILLAITSFVGIIYKESVYKAYLLCAVVFGLISYISIKKKPNNSVFYTKEAFVSVALSWVFLSLVGALPLFLTKEIPSYIDALFETISGFTTTGSTILTNVEALSHASLFWRSLTHLLGGMGVLVFILAIVPMTGGYGMNIMKAESPGPSVSKLVSKVSSTAKILYGIYLLITFIEFVMLLIFGMPVFDAINTAMATAGTGGFGIKNDSLASYPLACQNIVATFMMIFAINFNVYYLLLIKKVKDALKSEELRVYLCIVAISVLLISINVYPLIHDKTLTFSQAYFQVTSISSSTGFATTDFNLWPTFSKTILITLMLVGACAGSTGGGIKLSRIIIVFKECFNNIISYTHPRNIRTLKFEGKALDDDTTNSIKSYIVLWFIVLFGSILIISLDGYDYATTFSSVLATLNNIGPGLNVVGPAGNFASFSVLSKFVFMFDMLAGRLELIPVLILFMPSSYRKLH